MNHNGEPVKPDLQHHLEFPGLTAAEVEESRQAHGANILTPPPRDPWWKLYLEKFEDPIIRILLVAAVIAILAGAVEGHYTEGIGIIIAVLLATTLGFINEYKAGREFDILNLAADSEPYKVIRDGQYTAVHKKDLVVGDVVSLEQGEEVPADAEVLSAVSFQINEASLTGESLPVTKRPQRETATQEADLAYPRHQVLRGTFVSDGHGLIRVTSVGDDSEIGRTARAASEETETETPLNRQLGRLSQVIGVCGFAVALLIFLALTIRAVWLNDLSDQKVVESHPLTAAATATIDSPSPQALADARDALRARYGDMVEQLPVLSKFDDGEKVFYLAVPLDNGRIYILAALFLSLFVGLIRIWLPVVFDAVELTGRKRPAGGWLEREGFAPWAVALGAGAALFVLAAGLGSGLGWVSGPIESWIPVSAALELLRFFMVAVTIIVVAVPEGLPMSVTLSLAYSMRKMTAANNLVRNMHACETIGAATVICSDKTGTLTMNEMRVAGCNFTNEPKPGDQSDGEWPLLVEAMTANSTANLGEGPDGRLTKALGNPTEGALLLWLAENGADYQVERKRFAVSGQLTFSTERKYMATVGQSPFFKAPVLHVKGAPEIILRLADSLRLPDGQIASLDDEQREQQTAALQMEQSRGMRTLGLACRQIEDRPDGVEYRPEEIEALVTADGLVWLGFVSIADPVRPEVPEALAACGQAGVKVKIVTGDNQATAQNIAREIGLLAPSENFNDITVTGDDFMALDDEAASERSRSLKIMSRARPLAKQRLVTLLQAQGEVVAVTGDGSNDAPALNHADVGLAMGITGTSVAKEAADIILLDDSFASIVKAVMWGRSLYANIQKFILFQLSINISALGIALLGPFLGIQLPLTVTQMLWVNLIMDTFAALALASEPPDWSVMLKPPRRPEAFIISPDMAKFIFTVGGCFVVLFLIVAIGLKESFPMEAGTPEGRHNLSIFFSVFVFLQFWNLFNARMLGRNNSAFHKLSASPLFIVIALVIALGQIAITQFGGEVFRTVPLSFQEWICIIAGTSVVLWIGEISRGLKRMGRSAATT